MIEQYKTDLAKLTELRSALISEQDNAWRELESIRQKSIQSVLERADLGTLAEQKSKLELLIEANIAAVDTLDLRIKNTSILLDVAVSNKQQQDCEVSDE